MAAEATAGIVAETVAVVEAKPRARAKVAAASSSPLGAPTTGPGAPGIAPTHPIPSVTAIIDMGQKVGIVSNPSLVLGRTRSFQNEKLTSLEERRKRKVKIKSTQSTIRNCSRS